MRLQGLEESDLRSAYDRFFKQRTILRAPVGATWTDKADHLIRCSLSLGPQLQFNKKAPGSQGNRLQQIGLNLHMQRRVSAAV
jgi:hypothetical protein